MPPATPSVAAREVLPSTVFGCQPGPSRPRHDPPSLALSSGLRMRADNASGSPNRDRCPSSAKCVSPRILERKAKAKLGKRKSKIETAPTPVQIKATALGDENLSLSGDEGIESEPCSDYNVFAGGDEHKEVDDILKQKKYSYLQSQDGRPAEMYRTDLIHRIRAGEFDEEDDSDDEGTDSKLIKLNEKWREDWSSGVQVPVDLGSLPKFEYFRSDLPNEQTQPYIFPSKFIGKEGKKYVSEDTHVLKCRNEAPLYQADRVDELWLERYNSRRVSDGKEPLPINVLINITNALEVDCFKNMHLALLQPLHSPSYQLADEDAPCNICGSKDSGDDVMVFCEGCNMCVHLSCYGLPEVPNKDWLCMTCTMCYGRIPPCVLCPTVGGALKCTSDGLQWAHVACALFIPECIFVNWETREPIDSIDKIPDERWKMRCSICDTRQGACIQCSVKACTTAFHVTCAQRRGLDVRIDGDEDDNIQYISLCEKHSHTECSKDEMAAEIKRIEGKTKPVESAEVEKSPELCKMEQNFYIYVAYEEISKRLNLPVHIVSDLYEYWKLKRHRRGGGPLLLNPHDELVVEAPILALPDSSSGDVDRDPQEREAAQAAAVNQIPTTSSYRMWAIGSGRLRAAMDTFRSLATVQVKREKMKANMVDFDGKIIMQVLNMVGANPNFAFPIPVSQRSLDAVKSTLQRLMPPDLIERALAIDADAISPTTPVPSDVSLSTQSPQKQPTFHSPRRRPIKHENSASPELGVAPDNASLPTEEKSRKRRYNQTTTSPNAKADRENIGKNDASYSLLRKLRKRNATALIMPVGGKKLCERNHASPVSPNTSSHLSSRGPRKLAPK